MAKKKRGEGFKIVLSMEESPINVVLRRILDDQALNNGVIDLEEKGGELYIIYEITEVFANDRGHVIQYFKERLLEHAARAMHVEVIDERSEGV